MASRKPVKPVELPPEEQEEELKETQVEETAEPEVRKEENSFCMYVGPNIVGVIQYGRIYGSREEAEAKEARAIERFPEIRALLVPGDEIAQARANIHKPGTRLYWCCQKIVNGLKT